MARGRPGRDSCTVVLIAMAGALTVLIALGIQAVKGVLA